jgi:hypothetical protein
MEPYLGFGLKGKFQKVFKFAFRNFINVYFLYFAGNGLMEPWETIS